MKLREFVSPHLSAVVLRRAGALDLLYVIYVLFVFHEYDHDDLGAPSGHLRRPRLLEARLMGLRHLHQVSEVMTDTLVVHLKFEGTENARTLDRNSAHVN